LFELDPLFVRIVRAPPDPGRIVPLCPGTNGRRASVRPQTLLVAARGFVWFEPEIVDRQLVFRRSPNGTGAAVSLSALNDQWR
jgi:hypothetical protein